MRTNFLSLAFVPLFLFACSSSSSSPSATDAGGDSQAADSGSDGSTADCATLGGTCGAVSACAAGAGHLSNGTCSGGSASVCCLPEAACPAETFLCCSATAQFRPSCEKGALTCDAPLTKCGADGGADAATD